MKLGTIMVRVDLSPGSVFGPVVGARQRQVEGKTKEEEVGVEVTEIKSGCRETGPESCQREETGPSRLRCSLVLLEMTFVWCR